MENQKFKIRILQEYNSLDSGFIKVVQVENPPIDKEDVYLYMFYRDYGKSSDMGRHVIYVHKNVIDANDHFFRHNKFMEKGEMVRTIFKDIDSMVYNLNYLKPWFLAKDGDEVVDYYIYPQGFTKEDKTYYFGRPFIFLD